MARDFELQSRDEEILASIIDGTEYTADPESRIEELLLELKELIEGGGSSTDYATDINFGIDSSTFVITAQLKNKDGDPLGTAKTVDIPLESTVVSGSYNAQTKSLILTLVSGQTITIPIGDIISGLQAEITAQNPLDADLVSDTTSAHKFVTASDKTTWNGKQDALTFDSAPTASSTNPVTSGGVYTALADKQGTIDSTHKLSSDLVDDTNNTNKFVTTAEKTTWNGKQDALTFDTAPTENSTNPVTSGGVYTAIAAIQQTIGNINTVLEEVL